VKQPAYVPDAGDIVWINFDAQAGHDKLWEGGWSTLGGMARASFRAAGLPEQAPSFDVISIVVRRAIRTRALAFFRVEGCLLETYQLLRQDQKTAIR